MRDYKLHMQMVGFLHQLYPKVHISLHAGELNSTLVPIAGLRFHIRDAIETAHAERIGHGVSVVYENEAKQLLKEMTDREIMVEINLTSNEEILGITGKNHPLPLYLNYHVPVALSTDDEGVLRTNLTEQYQKAVNTYHLSYSALKMLARNSISYSFLPGKNLWEGRQYHKIVTVCHNDFLGAKTPSAKCQAFLNSNERARMQWELERRFSEFENNLVH
jgi:adenosine deaminase